MVRDGHVGTKIHPILLRCGAQAGMAWAGSLHDLWAGNLAG